MVNDVLKDELKEVHSIALNTLDHEEYEKAGKFVSPGCTK